MIAGDHLKVADVFHFLFRRDPESAGGEAIFNKFSSVKERFGRLESRERLKALAQGQS